MPQIVSIIIKGGIVMIPLLACSLISLALSIERFLFWTRLKSKTVINEIFHLVERGEYEQALRLGKISPQPIARVLAAGIAHRNPAPAKAMEAAAQAEIPVLKSRLGILDTIVTLAPLLGLLGTVVGMIGSFDVMADVGIGQPHAVTGACNLAFFWLAITGVYLWWPPSWHWRALNHSFLFNPHLRGKARDWNWHNVHRLLVILGSHRSNPDGSSHVLLMGQRFALYAHEKRAAAPYRRFRRRWR
jgi:biopolymer transport protein ExbB